MTWLSENIGTVVVLAVLSVVLGLIIWRLIANKRAGKSSCGCGCGCQSCAMKDQCHK